jgi:hypothetical protein
MKIIKSVFAVSIVYTLLACSSSNNSSTIIATQNIQKEDTLITFNNEAEATIPKGFIVGNTCTQAKWSIINDNGNKVIAQQNKSESDCFNILMLDNLLYKNFILTTKIKAVAGDEDMGGGLVWRYIDNKNYYIARCNPLENNFRLYKVVNGNRKQLESVDCAIKSGEWFTMSISMNGNNIICSLNGNKMIEESDDTYQNGGKVGLWTKSDAQSYFDDLSVQPIK